MIRTKSGFKEIDDDVSEYIHHIQNENKKLKLERNYLEVKVLELEFILKKGWKRIFYNR